MSRVDNVAHLAQRLQKLLPLESLALETVRFDTQLLQNAQISGVEYQQGTLQGYEVREYLLAHCGVELVLTVRRTAFR